MAGYLGRIATGPTLSKDLGREEARDGMRMILRGEVGAAQAAVFLIALRMKRESHDELCGVLEALRESASVARAEVDTLVDMAEPYNGYVRVLPMAPFVPAVLAACEVPCVLHGCRDAGPKWGVSAHRILAAAGARVDLSPGEAAARVAGAGWAYVDLPRFCPPLDSLALLRRQIVKRPCLSLLEKLIAPVRPRAGGGLHLWVGFAHREYPEILERLAREFGYASMLAVRGVEGGVTTSITGRMRAASFAGEQPLAELQVDAGALRSASPAPSDGDGPAGAELPALADIGADDQHTRNRPGLGIGPSTARVSLWAAAAAAAGRAAFDGAPGDGADALALAAGAMLRHLGRVDELEDGVARARAALSSGAARAAFEAGGA
ncbi:Glycosyl transferase, family 3-like protein [Haliangium ochraceum DSM 14365]|uniref:Glycosyl transferase, family 3-like protein n=2 Tax=Haliangium ochraceum TaxID=80816 RepID=D0LRG4_HALO1|nr:Glycosyl transferase, family 3-like protein [Haliangium ochraceum DSM 14365]